MSVDPARRLAFEVLRAVEERDAYANLELTRLARWRRVGGRDLALATELAAGTLRMRGAYDAVIDALVERAIDAPVRDVLRLGCHQLLSMRVPDHAAVGTAVALTRTAVGHRPAGFVNAVLRRVAARGLPEWMDRLDASLATRTSHPEWVVALLGEALGERAAELPDLLAADNRSPRVTLVARPGMSTVAELEAAGGTAVPIAPYAVELAGGDPAAIGAVASGRAGVQDAGSQLVALLLTAAPIAGEDRHWLDLCAGPGGKSALLCAEAAQMGASDTPRRHRWEGAGPFVLANEVQPHRAALVTSALRAVPSGVAGVIVGDGTRPAWSRGRFDRVLLDAPCTGLGALRRRPEARWRRRPGDVADLVALQRELLDRALASTRPGGVVCYATCSPVRAETVDVVGEVLARSPGVSVLDAPALLPWLNDARSAGLPEALQLWPHRHGTDAMFAALLRVEG